MGIDRPLDVLKQFVRHRLDPPGLPGIGFGRKLAIVFDTEQHQARLVPLGNGDRPAQGFGDDVARFPERSLVEYCIHIEFPLNS